MLFPENSSVKLSIILAPKLHHNIFIYFLKIISIYPIFLVGLFNNCRNSFPISENITAPTTISYVPNSPLP